MNEHFDLANVGRTNRLHAQDEANIIRKLIIRKCEALENIEREHARLLEEKEAIEKDLIRFKIALSPHKLLPNEIFGEIFILLALDYGPVELPVPKNKIPPQLVVSHVCSRWRTVALCIPELWNNTGTYVPYSICLGNSEFLDIFNRSVQLNRQWILRAGDIPAALSLNLRSPCHGVLEGILSPIKLKKLHLDLVRHDQVTELCGLPDTALPNLEELSLTLLLYYYDCNFDKPFFTRLQSVTFSDVGIDVNVDDVPDLLEGLSLPWHQLQRFGVLFDLDYYYFPIIINFGMPNLRQLVCHINASVEYQLPTFLSLPNLQNLTLRIRGHPKQCNNVVCCFTCPALTRFCNDVVCSFACPVLTRFELHTPSWTPTIFKAIKQQYNLERLQEFVFIINDNILGTILASAILRNAPMLRLLQLPECAIMDTEAIMGLSNGTFGRFLRKLYITWDATEIVKMAEKRKEVVDELIKGGCSWREEITVLREVICASDELIYDDERVVAFKKAGITICSYLYQ